MSSRFVSDTKLSFGRTTSCAPSVPIIGPVPETSDNITQVALHKKGLFVAGNDGWIYELEIGKGLVLVQKYKMADGACSISSLSFDPPHTRLAVGTQQVTPCFHSESNDGFITSHLTSLLQSSKNGLCLIFTLITTHPPLNW